LIEKLKKFAKGVEKEQKKSEEQSHYKTVVLQGLFRTDAFVIMFSTV